MWSRHRHNGRNHPRGNLGRNKEPILKIRYWQPRGQGPNAPSGIGFLTLFFPHNQFDPHGGQGFPTALTDSGGGMPLGFGASRCRR